MKSYYLLAILVLVFAVSCDNPFYPFAEPDPQKDYYGTWEYEYEQYIPITGDFFHGRNRLIITKNTFEFYREDFINPSFTNDKYTITGWTQHSALTTHDSVDVHGWRLNLGLISNESTSTTFPLSYIYIYMWEDKKSVIIQVNSYDDPDMHHLDQPDELGAYHKID